MAPDGKMLMSLFALYHETSKRVISRIAPGHLIFVDRKTKSHSTTQLLDNCLFATHELFCFIVSHNQQSLMTNTLFQLISMQKTTREKKDIKRKKNSPNLPTYPPPPSERHAPYPTSPHWEPTPHRQTCDTFRIPFDVRRAVGSEMCRFVRSRCLWMYGLSLMGRRALSEVDGLGRGAFCVIAFGCTYAL